MQWSNLPWELRQRSQWCVAGANKEPLTQNGKGLTNAKVDEPRTWMTFEEASSIAAEKHLNIGYVLHEDDPYSCIDFDIKDAQNAPERPDKWTDPAVYDTYLSIITRLNSYTEQSISGKGFHTWVKGKIGRGVRSNGIEIYSQDRFIICTGHVTVLQPIENRNIDLIGLAQYLRPNALSEIELDDLPEENDDWYIIELATNAENGEKFVRLWAGDWKNMNYPSQSEADLALMSMLTFYSPSNSQVRRLFRSSKLGQRTKAIKNDTYLNYTLRTIRAREKTADEINVSEVIKATELFSRASQQQELQQLINQLQGTQTPSTIHPLHVAGQPIPNTPLPIAAAQLAAAAPVPAAVHAAGNEGLPWPPGVTGHIARFVYQSSYLSVKEVSIVAALGLLAGLCGKGWHIPLSGLNLYIILIAKSGIGKEAMHSGISFIVKSVTEKMPIFTNFVDFRDMASGPALTKACSDNPCFVNVLGEWGHKLRRMAIDDNGGPMTTLRTNMTDLYQKSGPSAIVGGIRYSKTEDNIQSISGVSYSMIGETTPGVFYNALTESMMEDGFLSRFLCIEYDGERPMANENIIQRLDSATVDTLSNMAQHADRAGKQLTPPIPVVRFEDASAMLLSFEIEARNNINGTQDESRRQMWNRASLKVKRISALLAVAENYIHPCITLEQVNWAIDVVRRDIAIMSRRLEEGDVGTTDTTRERKILSILTHYVENPLPYGYRDQQKFKDGKSVAYKYIQQHTGSSPAFKSFRGGTRVGLTLAIQALIDSGYIAEMQKDKVFKEFGFHGKVYRILSLPKYEE